MYYISSYFTSRYVSMHSFISLMFDNKQLPYKSLYKTCLQTYIVQTYDFVTSSNDKADVVSRHKYSKIMLNLDSFKIIQVNCYIVYTH